MRKTARSNGTAKKSLRSKKALQPKPIEEVKQQPEAVDLNRTEAPGDNEQRIDLEQQPPTARGDSKDLTVNPGETAVKVKKAGTLKKKKGRK